jgi:hypothetical protein
MEDVKFWATVLESTDSPLVYAAILGLGAYMTLSKKLAEVKGPIGALARWWTRREERRIERAQRVWRAKQAVNDEQTDARVIDLTEQVEYLREELKKTRLELAIALRNISRQVGRIQNPAHLPVPRPSDEERDTQRMAPVLVQY